MGLSNRESAGDRRALTLLTCFEQGLDKILKRLERNRRRRSSPLKNDDRNALVKETSDLLYPWWSFSLSVAYRSQKCAMN